MKLLIALYPQAWRERYGEEMLELIRNQPVSTSLIIDLLSGAIDARLNPGLVPSPGKPETPLLKGEHMQFAQIAKMGCAGFGPKVTSRDRALATAIMLGGSALMTILWLGMLSSYRGNPLISTFIIMPFPVSYALAMPLTSLKGKSVAARAVLCGATVGVVTAIWLATSLVVGAIS